MDCDSRKAERSIGTKLPQCYTRGTNLHPIYPQLIQNDVQESCSLPFGPLNSAFQLFTIVSLIISFILLLTLLLTVSIFSLICWPIISIVQCVRWNWTKKPIHCCKMSLVEPIVLVIWLIKRTLGSCTTTHEEISYDEMRNDYQKRSLEFVANKNAVGFIVATLFPRMSPINFDGTE